MWRNSVKSRADLGYPETVMQLTERLSHCHPTGRASVRHQLEKAKRCEGSTVFEWLVDIITKHQRLTLVLE